MNFFLNSSKKLLCTLHWIFRYLLMVNRITRLYDMNSDFSGLNLRFLFCLHTKRAWCSLGFYFYFLLMALLSNEHPII